MGEDNFKIDVEGHGREDIVEGINISRTVGWFTSLFPINFMIHDSGNLEKTINDVKEQFRRIPNKGIGFGLLRYLNKDKEARDRLLSSEQSGILFNYLGQTDNIITNSILFGPHKLSVSRGMANKRSHLLEIYALVTNNRLQVSLVYSKNLYQRTTIENLGQDFLSMLHSLIDHCQSANSSNALPSDFPLANLDDKKLDKLTKLLEAADRKQK